MILDMRVKKYSHSVGSRSERIKAGVIGLVILLIGAGLFWWQNQPSSVPQQNTEQATEPEQLQDRTTITKVTGTYLFSGTVVPARAIENEARRTDGTVDYAQPFSKLNTFNPSQYDAWLIDFECPMTENDIPYQTQVANTVATRT